MGLKYIFSRPGLSSLKSSSSCGSIEQRLWEAKDWKVAKAFQTFFYCESCRLVQTSSSYLKLLNEATKPSHCAPACLLSKPCANRRDCRVQEMKHQCLISFKDQRSREINAALRDNSHCLVLLFNIVVLLFVLMSSPMKQFYTYEFIEHEATV